MNPLSAPTLRNDFVIIVDSDKPALLAAVLSLLNRDGQYLPVFSFPAVDVACAPDSVEDSPDLKAMKRRKATVFAAFVANAIVENYGCQQTLFVGLNAAQKSYLGRLHEFYDIMEIDDHDEVLPYLGGYSVAAGGTLECSEEQYAAGFYHAVKNNKELHIRGHHHGLSAPDLETGAGLVIVEMEQTVEDLIGIHYALSIGANILLVDPLESQERDQVLYLIEKWQQGDVGALQCLKDKISIRIGRINFEHYPFATFFTSGLPYPLLVRQTPCTMVNLGSRPDFFLYNAILSEHRQSLGSAAVFSPGFFSPNEEVDVFISLFEHATFYLRKLLGSGATVYNLRNTIELYPLDYLHICSHGGSAQGYYCQVEFHDTQGLKHTAEFDVALSVGMTPYADEHIVSFQFYFKVLDGMAFGSPELTAQAYPQSLFVHMLEQISEAFVQQKVTYLKELDSVPNTNAIRCHSNFYNAGIDQFSSDSHPFIFNNACWSWMIISNAFLQAGARGYIGTMQEIGNKQAVDFAKTFYSHLFQGTALQAFHLANVAFLQTQPEPLYVYWGLHFSTVRNKQPSRTILGKIVRLMNSSLSKWSRKKKLREGAAELLEAKVNDTLWIIREIDSGNEKGHILKN